MGDPAGPFSFPALRRLICPPLTSAASLPFMLIDRIAEWARLPAPVVELLLQSAALFGSLGVVTGVVLTRAVQIVYRRFRP